MPMEATGRGRGPIDATGRIDATGIAQSPQLGIGVNPSLEPGRHRTIDDVIELLSNVAADLGGREEAVSALAEQLSGYGLPQDLGRWLGSQVGLLEKHSAATLLPFPASNALEHVSNDEWASIRTQAQNVLQNLPEDSQPDVIVRYTFSNGVTALSEIVDEKSAAEPDPTLQEILARLDKMAAEMAKANQDSQPLSWQKLKSILLLLGQALVIAAVASGSLSSDRAAPAIANGIAMLVALQALNRRS